MTLADWLKEHDVTAVAFGERIGVHHTAVNRYVSGTRLPRPEVMARIVAETAGAVQPGDFYASQAAE